MSAVEMSPSESLPAEKKPVETETASASPERTWDAVIIGGGIGGLTAAAYMARAGKRTLLLEARDVFSGRAESSALGGGIFAPVAAEAFYAVDRKLIHDLQLHQFGLRFAQRAMPLTVLRPDGRHLTLPHELFSARAAILAEGSADASAYPRFRRELFALSRRLRSHWLPANPALFQDVALGSLEALRTSVLSSAEASRLDIATRSSANVFLQNWFQSDVLTTALAFDTTLDGVGPDEPASALLLVWRAAQESSGLQGAVGQIEGGPVVLADAIADAARADGAILRSGTQVTSIEVEDGRVVGLRLGDGSLIESKIVISTLCADHVYKELLLPDVQPFGALRQTARQPHFSSAKAHFALRGLPPFAGLSSAELRGRLIISEHPEAAAESKLAALNGLLPSNLVMEITVPSIADPTLTTADVHILSVRIPFLPINPDGGWAANESVLKKNVLSLLENYAPGLNDRIINGFVITPDEFRENYGADTCNANFLERLLAPYGERVRTSIKGLYLCGVDAEPVSAITGRAARAAASLALKEFTEKGAPRDE